MAADIILYDAHLVPVGKDQKQHVEYARDIAGKFNHMFGETFVLPEPMIQAEVATVPGIDGRKMSKSYNNYIGMFDDEATILKKVKRIPTGAFAIEDPKDPDICNVYNIFKLFLDEEQDTVLRKRYTEGGLSYKDVKHELAAHITDFLTPIQEKYTKITDDQVKQILADGANHVSVLSEKKIADVYQKVGFNI
jgi:tryptophanyl-tRNA synthetase